MEIFDETHAKDLINFPDVILTEIEASGRYYGAFTPDVEGIWNVEISSDGAGAGKVVKQYAVAGHDVDSLGDAVATEAGVKADVAALDAVAAKEATVSKEATAAKDATVAKEATVAKDATVAKPADVTTSEDNIRGVDNDTLKSLSDQVDSIDAGSGAMVG